MRTSEARRNTNEHADQYNEGKCEEIMALLTRLRLPAFKETLSGQMEDPNSSLEPFEDRLLTCLRNEVDSRMSKKISRAIAAAHLKFPGASIDDRIHDPERKLNVPLIEALAKAEWLNGEYSLIITGKTGCGKSYIACALAVCAIRKGYSAFCSRCNDFQIEVARVSGTEEETRLFHSMTSCDLLILDDFGLMNLSMDACKILLDIIDCRYENKTTIVTSQYPVSAWSDLFPVQTLANTCLDRLSRKSYRIQMQGPSLRTNDIIQ